MTSNYKPARLAIQGVDEEDDPPLPRPSRTSSGEGTMGTSTTATTTNATPAPAVAAAATPRVVPTTTTAAVAVTPPRPSTTVPPPEAAVDTRNAATANNNNNRIFSAGDASRNRHHPLATDSPVLPPRGVRQATPRHVPESPTHVSPVRQATRRPGQPQQQPQQPHVPRPGGALSTNNDDEDREFVEQFWTIYDDILILSLFTQLGILARLGAATFFSLFDNVFSNQTPLFVNLPLNCMSTFIMGLLCSGERLMEIISTRFSPPQLQQHIQRQAALAQQRDNDDNNDDEGDDQPPTPHGHRRTPRNDSSSIELSPVDPTAAVATPPRQRRSSPAPSPSSGHALLSPSSPPQGLRQRRHQRDKRHRHPHTGGSHPSSATPTRKRRFFHSWQPPVHLNEELRDVQLLALERRIRRSKCLVLFPVSKQDVDVMEHYFDEGYKRRRDQDDEEKDGLMICETDDNDEDPVTQRTITAHDHDLSFTVDEDGGLGLGADGVYVQRKRPQQQQTPETTAPVSRVTTLSSANPGPQPQILGQAIGNVQPTHATTEPDTEPTDLDLIVSDVSANVSENLSRLRRVKLADGWDRGTTAEAMSDDIMLGLRDGFCGAISSFSSWNSAMINLILDGKIGEAFVGYMLGLQLPIVAYRFGQHVAVFIFMWRCRREARRDERRGYGIRLATNENSDLDGRVVASGAAIDPETGRPKQGVSSANVLSETPSIRAIVTAIFVMALVTQCTSINFYNEPRNQILALSMLFSPLGVLARWRLSKYNSWQPTFPVGTFTSNMLACALSGGLRRLLARDVGEEERLVLTSFVNGFGGTLSSVAAFVVEILAGIDPILFRFDGVIYALSSIGGAALVGFLFSASVDWADETE